VKPNPREMTVARLRQARDADGVDVAFVESARFYRLANDTSDFKQLLERLQQARDAGRRVRVTFSAPGSAVIVNVEDVD
jgi:hypothetical protein